MDIGRDTQKIFDSSKRPKTFFLLVSLILLIITMIVSCFSMHQHPGTSAPGFFKPKDFGLQDVVPRKSPSLCLKDCKKLQSILHEWPKTDWKPKAAFYYLTQPQTVDYLITSLQKLHTFFTKNFSYPIIIFHESDWNMSLTGKVRANTKDKIFFQEVHFEIPHFLRRPVPQFVGHIYHYSIDYRHMCRFHAKTVYEQPIIQGFDYLFRLDDDSFIQSPINYDIFLKMKQNKLIYGYHDIKPDDKIYVKGLWEATDHFILSHKIKPQFFYEWPYHKVYYTNFEISRLDFWLSKEYREFVDYVDRLGGIYFHRWGDAPIKTIGVSLFVPDTKVHRFNDIHYSHGKHLELNHSI